MGVVLADGIVSIVNAWASNRTTLCEQRNRGGRRIRGVKNTSRKSGRIWGVVKEKGERKEVFSFVLGSG